MFYPTIRVIDVSEMELSSIVIPDYPPL